MKNILNFFVRIFGQTLFAIISFFVIIFLFSVFFIGLGAGIGATSSSFSSGQDTEQTDYSFVSGEKNLKYIAKKHRIIYNVADKIVQDFIKQGIVEKKPEGFILTKDGEKLAERI